MTILEELPARVDALTVEISQLREEMRSEFSAIRADIRSGDQEIMNHARMLYEDMKATLALMKESQESRKQRRSRK